jgi:hypothetical protein
LLENQLPVTRAERGFDAATTTSVAKLLLVVRLYSIVVQTRRDVRLEIHPRCRSGTDPVS